MVISMAPVVMRSRRPSLSLFGGLVKPDVQRVEASVFHGARFVLIDGHDFDLPFFADGISFWILQDHFRTIGFRIHCFFE